MEGTESRTLGRSLFIYCINYAPEMLGVGRYAGELGDYLHRQGVALEVITTPPHYPGWRVPSPYRNAYKVDRRDGVRINRCPILLREAMGGLSRVMIAASFALTTAPVVIWRALVQRPVVILATEPSLFSAPAALIAARLCGARAVLHVQDLEVEAAFAVGHLKGRRVLAFAQAVERFLLRRFDQVITISCRMEAALGSAGVAPDRLHVVRNWVDLASIYPKAGPNPFRQELGFDEDARMVLYAGNIGRKQALDQVLDAATLLLNDSRTHFVIAGDGPEKARLMSRATSNVIFLPLQPEELLNDLLNAADLHILPQDQNAADLVLPSKLGGMLASGKPIVVQADAGTELHSFLAGAATITPPGDPAALVAGLDQACALADETSKRRAELAFSLSAQSLLADFQDALFAR